MVQSDRNTLYVLLNIITQLFFIVINTAHICILTVIFTISFFQLNFNEH